MKCQAVAVAVASNTVLVSSVLASYTPIFAPPPGEVDHNIVLDELYGGDFVANGVDFTNSTITATRVHDDLPEMGMLGVIDGMPSDTADQIWHDGFITASAQARYAKYSQRFGYFENFIGGSYVNLFNVSGEGFDVSGDADLSDDLVGKIWRWSRSGANGPHSSLALENADLHDHLVTYQITGLDDGMTTWLLCWEDLTLPDDDVDYEPDFNDLVVEIKAYNTGSSIPVPEPTGALLGGIVVSTAMLSRARRRRDHHPPRA